MLIVIVIVKLFPRPDRPTNLENHDDDDDDSVDDDADDHDGEHDNDDDDDVEDNCDYDNFDVVLLLYFVKHF